MMPIHHYTVVVPGPKQQFCCIWTHYLDNITNLSPDHNTGLINRQGNESAAAITLQYSAIAGIILSEFYPGTLKVAP